MTLFVHVIDLPLLVRGIEEIVTPQLFHHFIFINTEFLGINSGELGQSESPTFLTRTESNGTFIGLDEEVTHIFLVVSINNNVDHINNSDEVLIHGFTVVL